MGRKPDPLNNKRDCLGSKASRQRAEMAAAAGWACRNAGLFTEDFLNGERGLGVAL